MSWHSKNVRQPGVTTQVLLADALRERDEARAEIVKLKKLFREKHEDCDEARAIARRLSNPLRYHAEHGCQMCSEHVAEFDAVPWAKDDNG